MQIPFTKRMPLGIVTGAAEKPSAGGGRRRRNCHGSAQALARELRSGCRLGFQPDFFGLRPQRRPEWPSYVPPSASSNPRANT